jgi:FkbM family methyltransferase
MNLLPAGLTKALRSSSLRRFVPHRVKEWYWHLYLHGSRHQVLGSTMFLPPDQRREDIIMGEYESATVSLLSDILHEGMTFCDVGANIGIITLFAARRVGPRGRVIAFEPTPANAEILRRNIALNGYGNVTVIQKAVFDAPGTARLYLSEYRGCHSLFPGPNRSSGEMIEVETVRLDSLPEISQVDVLKIDAEGADLGVLRSLGAFRPAHVILEYNSERMKAAGLSSAGFLECVSSMGYEEVRSLDDPQRGPAVLSEGSPTSVNLYLRHRAAQRLGAALESSANS